MSTVRENTLYKELKEGFLNNRIFGHLHPYDLYRNWLEAMWLFFDAGNNKAAFKEGLDKYTREQGEEFSRLMMLYSETVKENPFGDILGELFMELDIQSARSGQYFTPWEIAEFMTRMTFSREGFERAVKEKGEVTVIDPAVGSGVMLLAYGKIVHDEFGREGVNKLRLYGTDIDIRCVHMCKIQLRINGLDSFGRMVCRMGQWASAQTEPGKTPEIKTPIPDISKAIVLHGNDNPEAQKDMGQLELF
ncbi:MAG: hypothetical protein A2283_24310 [Lentisphaerae bacterium RIFOXYA12_FULL_48_11]|nr:MAG: hypothetical protein A2283_24310 [Lentisphaerae bacterium RIFOXYA12_FULL_48_11]